MNRYLTHTMRIEDIYSIRDRSEAWKKYKTDNSKKCPWVTDEEQMMLKPARWKNRCA
ncbi:hypothetical protein [Cronobacter sakazakii]|uniref:hypothetical protein n=1 Tax=Cronobacter sakazakii TaxID=28141 RepID=UPI001F60948E|nr:hypothetical protein [Cronobacter sakazakii]